MQESPISMKHILYIVFVNFLFSLHAKGIFIIDNNKLKDLCIVLDEIPTVSASFATRELQYHIQQSLGIQLPVFKGEIPNGGQVFCVGESFFTRVLGINTNEF